MIRRRYATLLRRYLRSFPAVTVLGPRQCGKTTFIRATLPTWRHVDLERPSEAAPLQADPEARLRQLGDRVVFDEAQRVPELFPVLRALLDERRSRTARYVLLGSAAPALVRGISESLAGRTAFLDMAPLRWDEVVAARKDESLTKLWLRGGFPRALLARDQTAWRDWMEAYTRSLVERDLPALGVEIVPSRMRTLWAMLAHRNAQTWNASQLASSLGVSYHTVNRHVDILEQAFLVRKLRPWHAKVGKRLVKSPKVLFRDTGLLHWFLGIATREQLDVNPARGASWESFVVDHVLSACEREAPETRPWFWRTAAGDEVDLVLERGSDLVPIEIKAHSAPTSEHAAHLRRCMRDLRLSRGYVIHAGDEDYSLGGDVTALSAASLLADPKAVAKL